MSNLNWATAPIDATHVGNSPYERGVITWFKDVGHGNHSFLNDGSMQSWHKGSGNLREWSLVERPKQWSGPQDGLPPVGFMCEAEIYKGGGWIEGFVAYYGKAHFIFESTQLTVGVEISGKIRTAAFRALKTPVQLAAEQRETAIREIMDAAGIDCRVTAARLVDAGFKREVV